jgi:predicted transposase YbfD/YdcC
VELGLLGAAQLARLDRHRTVQGQTKHTQLWLTTSRPLEALGPGAFNQARRQEWGIENGRHYVLDVSGDEDRRLRVRTLNSLAVLTLLSRLSVALWKHTPKKRQSYYSWREDPKARGGGLRRILCASP